MRTVQYIICCCVLVACSFAAGAQVLVKASVDKDRILIGEPVQLLLDVRAPLGSNISWFSFDTIPHFEFLQKGKVDTIEGVDGKKIQQIITITSYDTGYREIPRFTLKVANKVYLTDTLGVTVAYTPFNPEAEYRDIKDIVEVPNPSANHIPWIIAGFSVLAIALIIYLLRTRKKKATAPAQPVTILTPYEEAIQALEALHKKGWQQNGEVKIYYTQLNDILRVFIFRKLKMNTLEKTNEELILQLRSVAMDSAQYSQLSEALRIADFVKFAKYKPDANDNEKHYNSIRAAITTLNNIT